MFKIKCLIIFRRQNLELRNLVSRCLNQYIKDGLLKINLQTILKRLVLRYQH